MIPYLNDFYAELFKVYSKTPYTFRNIKYDYFIDNVDTLIIREQIFGVINKYNMIWKVFDYRFDKLSCINYKHLSKHETELIRHIRKNKIKELKRK